MKTKTLIAALALSMTFATAYAQSEEQVLNSDPIDVDGYLHEKQVTDHELEQIRGEIRKQKNESVLNKEKTKGFKELSKTTEKLSETTEEYLDEKKDAQKEIADYNAKIKCLMEENPGSDCDKYIKAQKEEREQHVVQEVAVAQAAPAAVVVIDAPAKEGMGELPFETIKLLVEGGATNYSGDKENLTATAAGLRMESNINNRFSMGFGLNYAQLKTDDYANNLYNGYGGGYNNWYSGAFGQQGREIQFKKFGVDVNGKFFITQGQRFRPYIGVGLGYNMANLKYSQNDQNSYYGGMNTYNYGGEGYKTSYATGSIMIGTEIMLTRQIGINLSGTMSKAIGSGFSSSESKNQSNSPDQARLSQLADDIINSTSLSMFAGMVFVF